MDSIELEQQHKLFLCGKSGSGMMVMKNAQVKN
jgi:hypothetical protein